MQTTVKAGDKIEVLSLYGTLALRGLFIYSRPDLVNEYVTFLYDTVQDESLGDIRNHIKEEIEEFEITTKQINDYLKLDIPVDLQIMF